MTIKPPNDYKDQLGRRNCLYKSHISLLGPLL
ncbi:Protein of unknown function [Pyronema omphalodes CBS 100304]|uniref:Uncharacterized protein n=1 Tax=Pyronema omphalodes (strain CBS 100304) TaxID=1076935 RepID=U4L1W0_PYROM|nr:Protein of unknown function [Pyronema omphalodes CBS 100304]